MAVESARMPPHARQPKTGCGRPIGSGGCPGHLLDMPVASEDSALQAKPLHVTILLYFQE